jgi:hypothetical protein
MRFTIISTLILAAHFACAQESLTYVDLVRRLTDLEFLALRPNPGSKCLQWSSYDRKSRYDEASGKYVDWDANGDGEGIIRRENGKQVMAEMEGPGCIWRTWSAAPGKGHVRIYLDGEPEPAVDLPFEGYFDRKNPPFTGNALVHTVARGCNNYVPIPFQKSCKIVADDGWGAYFHFNYELFPKGTKLPTFKRELTPDERKALAEANETLNRCAFGIPGTAQPAEILSRMVVVQPGKTASIAQLKGPAAITGIRVKLDVPTGAAGLDVLRSLAIQMKWDGESEPSVWAPLGDFFGTISANHYRSLPLGHSGDGWWYCNWYMPFGSSAQVELVNDGKEPRKLLVEATHGPLSRPVAQYNRFHAKWHRDAFLPAEPERQIDWTLLKTEGSGRFVGVMLHVWNPRGSWWGEGDEKFFVDGEKFPSTIGTGSEDYFGYAWCDPTLFGNAFHNQPHNDGNNRGHIAVNRWHITDSVPFEKSFEGAIEKYYPNQRPTLYAATAYWYLAPGGKDVYKPAPLSERLGYWQPIVPVRLPGVIEGESLRVLSQTAGNPHEQDLAGFGGQWSNDAHLWWIDAKPGDKLELGIPVAKTGKYRLVMQLTKAPDYGVVQLSLDGKALGTPIDLYHGSVIPTGPVNFGEHELSEGEHKLEVVITGSNVKAIKNFMFGLDYVKLEGLK